MNFYRSTASSFSSKRGKLNIVMLVLAIVAIGLYADSFQNGLPESKQDYFYLAMLVIFAVTELAFILEPCVGTLRPLQPLVGNLRQSHMGNIIDGSAHGLTGTVLGASWIHELVAVMDVGNTTGPASRSTSEYKNWYWKTVCALALGCANIILYFVFAFLVFRDGKTVASQEAEKGTTLVMAVPEVQRAT